MAEKTGHQFHSAIVQRIGHMATNHVMLVRFRLAEPFFDGRWPDK